MAKTFKTLLSALLVAVMLLSVCVTASAEGETVYYMTELEGKYKTQGRTALVTGDLMLEWSASGLVFKADCSGDVKITVNATRLGNESNQGIFFTVVVDGKTQYENVRIPTENSADVWTSNTTDYPFHITEKGISEFTIAENLKSGTHTFEIYKQTEAISTAFGIRSIALNGEITAPPKDKKLYIEVVGDSIAAGLGNISTGGKNAPLYQDATRGWPYLAAKALSADFSVLAQSGITATDNIGWSGASSVTMPDVYPKVRYYSDKRTEYDFSREPDIIVVCLGTNDIWTYEKSGATKATVERGFKELLTLLRDKNQNAKIIWIHGMMTGDANSMISSAVSSMGGSDEGFYTLNLPKNVDGGQGHPSLSAQTVYANSLVDFIEIDVLKTKKPPEESSSDTSSSKENNTSSSTITMPQTSSPTIGTEEQKDVLADDNDGNGNPYLVLIPIITAVTLLVVAGASVIITLLIKGKKTKK